MLTAGKKPREGGTWGRGGSSEARAQWETCWASNGGHLIQRFSNLLFLLLFKLQELLYRDSDPETQHEVCRAVLFKWLGGRGGSMTYMLENDGSGPADPKFRNQGNHSRSFFQTAHGDSFSSECDRPGKPHF